MSKKERLSEFNRSNILSAAKELFEEKGIPQTTMDDIAKKADCSKSTIYVYFKSKDEIFDHIVLEYFTLLKDGIEKTFHHVEKFPDSFFAICNTVSKFYEGNPAYFESILGEIKIAEDEESTVLFQIYEIGEEINSLIEGYLKANIESGNIQNEAAPSFQTTFALWGAICGIISLAHNKEKYIWHKTNASKEEFMQNGFNLLLRSLQSN
ncbi:MAG: TetR/AcrR family transcriptional regulator [Defluviitaleaceae bacterium]|nr:TetR/AcrR family transcriptional regulator [Defluviitaleaceae bacterium]